MLADFHDRPSREVLEFEGAVGGSNQTRDLQAEMFEHAPDFAILAVPELHFDPLVASGSPLEVGVDRAVTDTLDLDTLDQSFQLLLADLTEDPGAIGALDSGRRKLELALEAAVSGEQKQAFGVHVEAADRHHPR